MKIKSYIISALVLLNAIPLISAANNEPLDMVYLLVEQTFGGILITTIGLITIFYILGMMSRMNPLTITYFCVLFATTVAIGCAGGVGVFLTGVFCIWYVWNGWKNFQNSGSGS